MKQAHTENSECKSIKIPLVYQLDEQARASLKRLTEAALRKTVKENNTLFRMHKIPA